LGISFSKEGKMAEDLYVCLKCRRQLEAGQLSRKPCTETLCCPDCGGDVTLLPKENKEEGKQD
jgi:DNA-directed RNA polymerase subunit RPC12/RpoP